MKNSRSLVKTTGLALVALSCLVMLSCDPFLQMLGLSTRFAASGQVTVPSTVIATQPVNIHVQFMVTSSQIAAFGGNDIVVKFDGVQSTLSFSFSSVPKGMYFIRTFLDVNGSGAPEGNEPIGTYPSSGQAFDFQSDVSNITIDLAFPRGQAPATPTGATLESATASTLVVSWIASPGAAGYKLYRDVSPTGSFATSIDVGAMTKYTDTALASGTTYYYKVSAYSAGGGESVKSNVFSGSTAAGAGSPPSAPTGLAVGTPTAASLPLSWIASVGVTGYRVYRDSSAAGPFATSIDVGNTTSYTDTGLAGATTYYYTVSAYSANGESPKSLTVSGTTSAPAGNTPATPAAFTVSLSTVSTLDVAWAASVGATSYQVYRDTGSTGTFSTLAYDGPLTSFTDANLAPGTTYYYKVKATNSNGSSAFLSPVSGTTLLVNTVISGWESVAGYPEPAAYLGAQAFGSYIYTFGGDRAGSLTNSVYRYDSSANTWTKVATLPYAFDNPAPAVVGNLIYLLSGEESGIGVVKSVWAFDPSDNSFTSKTPIPTGRYGHSSVVVNGLIYVIGGLDNSSSPLATVEVYDPSNDTWSARAPMPNARGFFGCVAIGTTIYVFGGHTGVPTYFYYQSVLAFDTLTNTWSDKADMPGPRASFTAVVVGDKAYIVAGEQALFDCPLTAFEYDPARDAYDAIAQFPAPKRMHAATALNGRIYVISGYNESNTVIPGVYRSVP